MKQFIGLELPVPMVRAIGAFQKEIADETTKNPIIPHITIIPPDALTGLADQRIDRALIDVAARTKPMKLRFAGFGTFDDRVAFLRVVSNGLLNFQQQLIKQLMIPVEATEYRPHITIVQSTNNEPLSFEKLQKARHWAFRFDHDHLIMHEVTIFAKPNNEAYEASERFTFGSTWDPNDSS